MLDHQIEPTIERALDSLSREPRFASWIQKYRLSSSRLFQRLTWILEFNVYERDLAFAGTLDRICPQLAAMKPLSQKALPPLLPLVDCVAIGMRREEYVTDVLQAISFPALSVQQSLALMSELRTLLPSFEPTKALPSQQSKPQA